MRHDDIRNKYTRHGGAWNNGNELFKVGEQMQYEWEKDFIAMKWAIDYLTNGGLSGPQLALDTLLKRVSEYSCPSNKKQEYKTKENCPLKEDCKNCFLTTPPNQDGDTIKYYIMEKEILEGNKLIKEFYTDEHIRGQFGRILSADEYKYHFSWDWLMPVVEKIEQSSRIDIYGKACKISQPQWDVDIAHIDEHKIKAVWQSVIDFIHFYNTQSK